MNQVLVRWNQLAAEGASQEILACCGSTLWARRLSERRPIENEAALLAISDEIWNHLEPQAWLEAFSRHPRIGEQKAAAPQRSLSWSAQEQQAVASADDTVKAAIAAGNRDYERRFGRVFIVCATGKPPAEILEILRRRLQNDDATELREAAEEQRKITHLRLKKWLAE